MVQNQGPSPAFRISPLSLLCLLSLPRIKGWSKLNCVQKPKYFAICSLHFDPHNVGSGDLRTFPLKEAYDEVDITCMLVFLMDNPYLTTV